MTEQTNQGANQGKQAESALKKAARNFAPPLVISCVLSMAVTILWIAGLFDSFERIYYDSMFVVRRQAQPSVEKKWKEQAAKDIAIVEYDETSKKLLRIKGTPPRRFFDKLVRRVSGKCKVVAFDYYFPRQAYPDSRTQAIHRNLRSNSLNLVRALKAVPGGPGMLKAATASSLLSTLTDEQLQGILSELDLPAPAEGKGARSVLDVWNLVANLPPEALDAVLVALGHEFSAPESPFKEHGLVSVSGDRFLEDLGFFGKVSAEKLEGVDRATWDRFMYEVSTRSSELYPEIKSGEDAADRAYRELDPGLLAVLDAGTGGFSLALRRLAGTVINTLFLEDINLGISFLWSGNVILGKFMNIASDQMQDPMLKAAAAQEGLINAIKDVDGVVRIVPCHRITGKLDVEFSLSLASVVLAERIPPAEITIDVGAKAGKHPLPESSMIRLNYIGGPRSITFIPLYRFLQDEVDGEGADEYRKLGLKVEEPVTDEEIAGRILLVGDTTIDGQDYVMTPTCEFRDVSGYGTGIAQSASGNLVEMPGVEVHAQAVFNILHDTWLKTWPAASVAILLAAVFTTGLLFYWHRIGIFSGTLLFVALVLLLAVSGVTAFTSFYSVFPMIPAIGLTVVNFVGGLAYQAVLQQRKKTAITSMFGKYVSDNLVKKMVDGDLEVDLSGRTKNLTVLFSDIRGFTRLSEGLDPGTVSMILQNYFSRMIRTIFDNEGTLDKLMGDAIMAFFGDPEEIESHPKSAARAALDMLENLEDLKATSKIPGMEQINIGIGVNTGLVTVGNLGSPEYFDYTVIGDNVNLGSRLEGLNKAFGTRIIISGSTWNEIKGDFEVRSLGRVQVAGKTIPVPIFELLSVAGRLDDARRDLREKFEAALELHCGRRFAEAVTAFDAILASRDDGPSRTYRELAAHYIEEPPPEGWDGVFIPKGK